MVTYMYDGEIRINTKINTEGINEGLSSVSSLIGQAMGGINLSMAGISAGIFGVAKASVELGMAFDSTMSQVASLSGATADELQVLSDKAREMGASTKFSATESAKAFTFMAQAGWKTTEMLDGISGVMSAAAADGADLALVANILTNTISAFGGSASDAAHYADVLATAAAESNTNIAMLGESFSYAAPVAGAYGFAIEDVATSLGSMANVGITASSAGTAFRQILSGLQGGATITAEAFGEMTLSMENADGSMKPWKETVLELRSAFDQMSEAEKAANAEAISGKMGMGGLLAIVNQSEEGYLALSGAIDNATGSADAMAVIMQQNLAGQIEALGGGIEELGLSTSAILTPAISTVVGGLSSLVEGFNGLSDPMQSFIIQTGLIAGVATGAYTVIKTLSAAKEIYAAITQKTATAESLAAGSGKALVSANALQIQAVERLNQARVGEANSVLAVAKAQQIQITNAKALSVSTQNEVAQSLKSHQAKQTEAEVYTKLVKAQNDRIASSTKETKGTEASAQASYDHAQAKTIEAQKELDVIKAENAHLASLNKIEAAKKAQALATGEVAEAEAILAGQKPGDYAEAYNNMANARKAQAIATGEVAVAEAEANVTGNALTGAKALQTVGTEANTTANLFNVASLKALTVAMLTSPLFLITAGSMAIGAISSAIDYLTSGYERQTEKVKTLSDEYDTLKSALTQSEGELEKVKTRIEEINAIKSEDGLTGAQEKELATLTNINRELDLRIENEKRLLTIKGEETEKETVTALSQKSYATQIYTGEGYEKAGPYAKDMLSLADSIEANIASVERLRAKQAELREENANLDLSVEENKFKFQENKDTLDTLSESITKLDGQIITNNQSLLEQTTNLVGASEAGNALKASNLLIAESVDAYRQSIESQVTATDDAKSSQADLNGTMLESAQTMSTLESALSDIAEKYADGKGETRDYVLELEAWRNEALKSSETGQGFKTALEDVNKTLAKSPEYYAVLTDRTKTLTSESNTLKKAMDESATQNGLTDDTIMSLIDSGYAAAIMFDVETGAAHLNKEAMIAEASSKWDVQIASLAMQKINLTDQISSEGLAAQAAAHGFYEEAKAILVKNAAAKDEIANIDAQIKTLENLKSRVGSYVPTAPKAAGGARGGSARTTENKEEINQLLKDEVDFLSKKKELNEISNKQYHESLNRMLQNEKLNAKERKYLEDEFHKSKVTLMKESEKVAEESRKASEKTYIESLDKQYGAEKEKISSVKDELKSFETESVAIVADGSEQKLDVISDEYLDRIHWIEEENSVYSSALNDQMSLIFDKQRTELQGEKDILDEKLIGLSITNKGLFDEITALRERNDEIKAGQTLRREIKQDQTDAQKLAELESKYAEAESDKQSDILTQIQAQKDAMSDRAIEKAEQLEIAKNNDVIKVKQGEINDNISTSKTLAKEFNDQTKETIELLTKALETGKMGEIIIPISFKGLEEGLAQLKELGYNPNRDEKGTSLVAQDLMVQPEELETESETSFEVSATLGEEETQTALDNMKMIIEQQKKPIAQVMKEVTEGMQEVTEKGLAEWSRIVKARLLEVKEMIVAEMNAMLELISAKLIELTGQLETFKATVEAMMGGGGPGGSPGGGDSGGTGGVMLSRASSMSADATPVTIQNNFTVMPQETAYQVVRETERSARMGALG